MFKWVRKPSFVLKFLLQILQDRTLVFASDLEEEQEDGLLSGFMTTFCLKQPKKSLVHLDIDVCPGLLPRDHWKLSALGGRADPRSGRYPAGDDVSDERPGEAGSGSL